MSRHSSEVRLRHMLDHAREAVDLAKGKAGPTLRGRACCSLASSGWWKSSARPLRAFLKRNEQNIPPFHGRTWLV